MRIRATLRLLAALSVLALLAAACGDDEPTTADDAPSGTDMSDTDMSDTDHDDDAEHDDDADHDHEADHDDTDHDSDGEMAEDHGHGMVEIAADGAPSVDIEVFADPAGGVNIHVMAQDYAITPRAASSEHVDGEGHFHLFVDGEKVLRFYNEWIYFAGVTEGEAVIAVELSANDHRAYAVDGERILAEATFVVPEHSHDAHSHGEATAVEFIGTAPSLQVEVVDDPKSGWNAFISLDGLALSPENASGDHVDGEGHLHIYANGQKLGRLYGLATHMGALPEGDVEISVVAYTNDHNPYVIDGQPISATAMVTVAS